MNNDDGGGSSNSKTDALWGLLEPDAVKVASPVLRGPGRSNALGLPDKASHTIRPTFDDPNLVSCAGLVPALRLAESAGLYDLLDERLSVGSPNSTVKTASMVGGMLAGADSIDDLDLLRHGGMGRLFSGVRAPSTLGTFLRSFSHGHVQQLDAVGGRLSRV